MIFDNMGQNVGESYRWIAWSLETFILYRVPALSILFFFFVFISIHAALETVKLYVTGGRPPGGTDFVTRSQNSKETDPLCRFNKHHISPYKQHFVTTWASAGGMQNDSYFENKLKFLCCNETSNRVDLPFVWPCPENKLHACQK